MRTIDSAAMFADCYPNPNCPLYTPAITLPTNGAALRQDFGLVARAYFQKGNLAVVGAPGGRFFENGAPAYRGAVYVFHLTRPPRGDPRGRSAGQRGAGIRNVPAVYEPDRGRVIAAEHISAGASGKHQERPCTLAWKRVQYEGWVLGSGDWWHKEQGRLNAGR